MGPIAKSALVLVIAMVSVRAGAECQWNSKSSHANYTACLLRDASQSEKAVVAAESHARQRLSSSSEVASEKERALALLESAAASFRKFKAAQCEFESSTAAGGNAAGDLRVLCDIALDKAYMVRLKDLHSFGLN